MKIEHIKIVKKEDVKQPLYRYVKPTDYYLSILGETTPTEAAMINNVYTLEMKAGEYYSYYNTTDEVSNFVIELAKK